MLDWIFVYGSKPLGGVFSQPQRFSPTNDANRNAYRLIIAGMVWYFYVTSHCLCDETDDLFLQLIWHLGGADNRSFTNSLY